MPLGDVANAHEHAFPLALAGVGEQVRIASLNASKNVERRLSDLGLPVGTEIEVVHRQGRGRMVVGRGYARVALGAGMTSKILVTLSADACATCERNEDKVLGDGLAAAE